MTVEELNVEEDIHGKYTTYLFTKGHSLHGLMKTVHNIVINKETNTAVIKRRGCHDIPLKLLRHMEWYIEKNYQISEIKIV